MMLSQKILGVVVNTVAIVAVAVLALFASPASAGVTWNGDVNMFSTSDWTGGSNPATPPNHGWTFGNTDANANAAGASSLLVTDATLLATVFNLDSTLSAAELVRANGYFWEARVKTISHTGSQQSLGIIQRDDQKDGFGVYFYPSSIQWFDGNFANGSTFSAPTHFTADPSGYITVRLDVAAGDNFATMTINGTNVGTKNHDTGNNAGPHFSVGDHIGNVQDDASSHWDYVTINQQIPEPASVLLLGLGGLMLLVGRRLRA